MSWSDGLKGSALRIAASNAPFFRVMAGPGTGKTFAMMRRIARLLEQGVNPKKILAVTFTRIAAAMLLEELCSLGVQGCEKISAITLHGFCMSILRKHNAIRYLTREPRMITTYLDKKVFKFECAPLISDIMREKGFGAKKSVSKLIRLYEAAWASLQSQSPGWPHDQTERRFNSILTEWLKFHRAMLIGELVPMALHYLTKNPSSSEGKRFDYIVVDEYQDLNKADQAVIDFFSKGKQTLIVGDVNQSIYSFRFANPEGIIEYRKGDANLQDEPLVECRRCSTSVVNAANSLIKNNYGFSDGDILKPLPTQITGSVSVVYWDSITQEIEGIAQYILKMMKIPGTTPGDFLILVPRRKIAYMLHDLLCTLKVDRFCYYQDEYIDNENVQLAITKLRLLENSHDRVALRFWLGQNSDNHNAVQYKRLRAYSESSNLEPFDLLESIRRGSMMIDLRIPDLLELFDDLMLELEHMCDLEISDLIDHLFPKEEDWTRRILENLNRCIDEITDLKHLVDWVDSLAQPERPANDNHVRIMSFHKSKGLKSKYVVLMSCLEGLIPVYDGNLSDEELVKHFQEQRRVFYVGMTRCVESLVVSYPNYIPYKLNKQLNTPLGDDGYSIMSRFVSEIQTDSISIKSGINWLEDI